MTTLIACKCGSTERGKDLEKVMLDKYPVGPGYYVVCLSCGLSSGVANYKEEAIFNWNEMIRTDETL